MDMIFGINVNFIIVFLIFSNICYRSLQDMSYNKIYELFTISFLKTDSQLFSSVQ